MKIGFTQETQRIRKGRNEKHLFVIDRNLNIQPTFNFWIANYFGDWVEMEN